MRYKTLIFLFFCFAGTQTRAELPLTIEDLTADKNRFKLNTSLSYYNQNNSSVSQNAKGKLVHNLANNDSLFANIGLKYGLTDKLDIGVSVSGYHSNQRSSTLGSVQNSKDTGFQGVNLSSQYQLTSQHEKFPDSLVFVDVSAYDKGSVLEPDYLSAITLGGSIYKVNDPIALSLNASYQYNHERDIKNTTATIDIGDVISLSGSVGFAVNPDITLTSGVSWQSRQPNRIVELDREMGGRHTQTSLNFGMAYAVSERSNFIANVATDISGASGSILSFGLTTKLGKLAPPLSQKYRQNLQKNK